MMQSGKSGQLSASDVIGLDMLINSRIVPNTEMYSSATHFRAYHHAFSLTRKRVLVVRNFVTTITLSLALYPKTAGISG